MQSLLITAALVVIGGPLLLALLGLVRTRTASATATTWHWRLTASSALLYTLAYNLTFFLQELFLVIPKAFTPGLRPTLFHNNHSWTGEHPLASLFQGTGVLAILVSALLCAVLLSRRSQSTTLRLFLIWMTYNGVFQALPQFVFGALNPGNDVGMAMQYLQLSPLTRNLCAYVALAAIAPLALALVRPLLSLAATSDDVASPRQRMRFMFSIATLPALLGIALIIPFRVPRELIEVALLPVISTVAGVSWLQAAAWRATVARVSGNQQPSIWYPLAATVLLLAIFQLGLRPGVHFYIERDAAPGVAHS